MANRMFKALASRVVSRFIGAVLQALSFFLIARAVGATEFGWFAQGMACGYVGAAIASLGLSNRVLTVNGQSDPGATAGKFFAARTFSIPVGVGFAVLVALIFGLPWTAVVLLGLAVALFDHYTDFLQAALAGLTRDTKAVVVIMAQRLLPFVALIGALVINPDYLLWAFAGGTIAGIGVGVVLVASSVRWARSAGALFDDKAVGFWFSGIASSLPQLQPAIAGAVLGPAVAGVYAVAVRVTSPLSIVPIGIQTILVPRISTANAERVRLVTKQALIVSAVYAALLAVLAFPLGWAADIALGEGFDHIVSLVAAFTVMSGAAAIAQVSYGRLIARHRAGLGAAIVIITTLVNLGFLWVIGDFAGAGWLWTVPLIGSVLGITAFTIADIRTSGPKASGEHAVTAKAGAPLG
ncbi:hypothetical protein IEU95_03575 [Hoyosella rhizosphaerae]|uniref:Polysaccharide biosynthesis protein n=1 Tax=Hoyosella rhizosphaerae TaxID=1755582 RepID=A0A916UB11_9ACTN|nr:hypothetical protein [Hoyosella rhizosphaerae]MBN4925895.1 hypothetical protein [Hoyosella rhizosphaerae]GGC67123.1 hypothetical protein GCM10011410_19730 [Hoyosella rhizosphaerae]